eukprot:g22191.t1
MGSLRYLGVRDNGITSAGLQGVMSANKMVKLQTLDLEGNHIGEPGLHALTERFQKDSQCLSINHKRSLWNPKQLTSMIDLVILRNNDISPALAASTEAFVKIYNPLMTILWWCFAGESVGTVSSFETNDEAFTELRLRRRDCYAGALLFSQQASAEEGSDLSQFIRFVEQDQIGWQIKLPKETRLRDWITIRKEAAPKGSEGGAKSLLFSGGPTQKSEIKVLRASVGSSKSNTLDFFLSKAPTMTKALSKSYEKKPSTFRFKLLKSKVVDRSSGRILRYGFSVARCEGAQAEIEGQRACVKPGTEDKLEAIARHWEECSVPSESWKEEAPQIKEIVDSFGVGTKAQLDELT